MKTIISFSGPSCSGKSTVEEELARRMRGAYTVSYDKLKWQVAGYDRDQDRELVKELLFGFFGVVCEKGLTIFLQTFMRSKEEFDAYASVAAANGYRIISVQFTAPEDVLIERFRERLARVKASNGRMAITNEELYRKNLAMERYVPEGTPLFDTSTRSAEEIADEIMALVARV